MKVTVNTPEGRFCTGCPFKQEIIMSWGMEESAQWCAYLKKDIPFNEYKQKLVKKLPDCPARLDSPKGEVKND